MKIYRSFLIVILMITSTLVTAQTKAEMLAQIERQTKTIDSLKAITANQENIIESRDRSIKFLNEDITKLGVEKEELNAKIRQKNGELITLRNNNKLGTAVKVTMNNTRATWTVPAGKHWIVNQVMADYITDLHRDSLGNMVGKEVHVFLKSVNNVILTDATKNQLGPQLYSSSSPNHTIQFPLLLTENTTFTIVIFKGSYNALEPYDGNVVCTYFEKEN
ncbi:MAG: hypothetical protein IPO32_12255 [Crocinitomicaceae bacterium]|jgi:hypothetical protein|nr:hypothetical protein [Crocinitomicaceae bacterium]MBK6953039.1 hypothetical protein [Crocinitomicaceae bacterium]MBK9592226.1 hypothetical protein [Crocinitomicaceae bacterium]